MKSRTFLGLLRAGAVTATTVVATILLVRAFDSRRMPELQPWHEVHLTSEFTADDFKGNTFEDYLAVEELVFEELEKRICSDVPAAGGGSLNRFYRKSPVYPDGQGVNWNRSREMPPRGPGSPAGGILLIHGLTDSPYSMRSIAEVFRSRGFHVLVARMPGHGTAPSGLKHARWQDWMAVLKLGVRHLRAAIGNDRPLYIGGYSNGGTLAMKYTLDSLNDAAWETPERVFLFSPAIGVTRFAVFASWHKALSFLPWFEKFSWESILPEFDPYKYNSFPKNAGHQTHLLTTMLRQHVEELAGRGELDRLPPVFAFQSVVDATVSTPSLIRHLFEHMPPGGSELVLIDVNRYNPVRRLLKGSVDTFLEGLEKKSLLPFRLTVVTNRDEKSRGVVAKHRTANRPVFDSTDDLGTSWPFQIYSLSHVAIPFPPDDPFYGIGEGYESGGVNLGAMVPRGEKGTLAVPVDMLMRLRHNPFFDYLEHRVLEFCVACSETRQSVPAARRQQEKSTSRF